MKNAQAKTVYLEDYSVPAYKVKSIDLTFDLGEEFTLVTSQVAYQYNPDSNAEKTLELHGEELELESIKMDGETLAESAYEVDDKSLTLSDAPEKLTLEIITKIYPQLNTSLDGLYQSSGNFCTQCEAQGFRKITYYYDRPDVMSMFSTLIRGDKEKYPVLLSNGNLVEKGELEGGQHFAKWVDPFAKPAYLFALVAGDLEHVSDAYTTTSGREVALEIYTETHNIDKCDHAMQSLKRAMQWDEERFGLEYDLDVYMIVAVDDFNMGAMENKGLNVFNSKLVFASPETATDNDYISIEAVIGHEYFHNWTGNRVTCRDWFQLSLKEGLTVFRDQEFTADLHSRAVKRVEDVRMLRTHQFAEDAGPMAHPIRPASFVEINNFYTLTIYEKGAEVVRLYHSLLGKDGFRKGMDLYFERHDGQAVTTEDFLSAMADANEMDLSQLQNWYDQAGTPFLEASMQYDSDAKTCTLKFIQMCPDTPESNDKKPFLIPVSMGLLDSNGKDMALQLEGGESLGTSHVLHVTESAQDFTFINVDEEPLPSLLRGFSAPVRLVYPYSVDQLIFLMQNDSDDFNRWEASQRLGQEVMMQMLLARAAGEALGVETKVVDAYQSVLENDDLDYALRTEALVLPSEDDMAEAMDDADPEAIYEVRKFLRTTIAKALRLSLERIYVELEDKGDYKIDPSSIGKRRLKNICLSYLGTITDNGIDEMCYQQFKNATNMTDTLASFGVLLNKECPQREQAISDFETRWSSNTLVMDKWFVMQATSSLPSTLDSVKSLMNHALFDIKNPNKVRSLIGAFANGNPVNFHQADGSAYTFIADRVLELDKLNPQIAARLVRTLINGHQYNAGREAMMREELERIKLEEGLSSDVFEIVSKSLMS
ncbi:MAG TPA: aminopeptidase N [Leucothrix mucor]|nr:aminopeptidase N [Leucothrix mucor]